MNKEQSQARQEAIKSLANSTGWRLVTEFVLGQQAMKFSEAAQRGTSSEDVLKAIGSMDAYKRILGWVESQSSAVVE